ncbi:MAG: hypothetical protein ACTHK2_03725 [Dokdonella sp.]|uniref:hypothetical protein n=1 Tax=Dokdonella sp. TaxID=2291710 RepID=UPI003F7F9D93
MNTKMKVLSLALVGLCGFAGSAIAACPAGPTTAEGGAWNASSHLNGTLAISTPGLDGTECKLDAQLTVNGPGGSAFVRDNSPATEPRYRAQFVINTDSITALNSIQSSQVFSATTDTAVSGVSQLVRLNIFGNLAGSQKLLGIVTACTGQPSNICSDTVPLAAGNNTVEIDWDKAAGSLKVWVNNNVEATPSKTITANNAAWSGVDFATLGLSSASAGFRGVALNKIVSFDRFDSRRQTFIGF